MVWKIGGTPKLTIQKTNKNIPRRNKYILENILLTSFFTIFFSILRNKRYLWGSKKINLECLKYRNIACNVYLSMFGLMKLNLKSDLKFHRFAIRSLFQIDTLTCTTSITLNIFKFYILKYIIKFLQSHGNNKKKRKFGFHNFAEHRLRTNVLDTQFSK